MSIWSNLEPQFQASDLPNEDRKQFTQSRGDADTQFKLHWNGKHKPQGGMLNNGTQLRGKFSPLHSNNPTRDLVVGRREEIKTRTKFSRPLKPTAIRRMRSDLLNLTPNKTTTKRNVRFQKSVYDMLLIDEVGEDDYETQKERELKRLEEIQEQRRIRMKHDSEKYGTHRVGEYSYLLPIEWMLDRGGVPYPLGYYPINLYDLITDNHPSLNLSLLPQRDGLPRRKDQVQLRYLPANLRAALIPLAFTSMDVLGLILLMVGWFLLLLCTAALIGYQVEANAATKCFFRISKNLIYQWEARRDPGLPDRLKKQAEDAGITQVVLADCEFLSIIKEGGRPSPSCMHLNLVYLLQPNTWPYLVLCKKDIGDDRFNRIALCIQHYYSFSDLIKRWEALKNSKNMEIVNAAIALMDAFLDGEYNYTCACL
ncbi:unnamed protein product [Hydatigera taeniaeformis]|uniref:Anoctamin n=1 Tax=Hydatigena taeniaeformis TaxID=6205 RepID=A0A0R3X7X3_HYDTA|nr:unnamed protein product [Hydatigera taeniaeformis]